MWEALLWGFLGASSLIVGGVIALRFRVRSHLLGLIMAFGAGVLISAVTYELVQEAFDTSAGAGGVGWGLVVGAVTFFVGDALIDRLGGGDRKRSSGAQAAGSPLAIVLGIVLDGIPESAVLGLTVLETGSVGLAMLVAVFLSNLPEAVAATTGLKVSGWRPASILWLWMAVSAISGLAAFAGYVALDGADPEVTAFVLSFAAGAILTMLADTMMPEAFEHGGKQVGLLTTLGFGIAFLISTLE
jgi:ZIP family zinc transporter